LKAIRADGTLDGASEGIPDSAEVGTTLGMSDTVVVGRIEGLGEGTSLR